MELIPSLQDSPEAHNIRVRDTLLVIAKALYFIHLVIATLYSAMLLSLDSKIVSKASLSLVLLIIYGFMLIWLILFNFICVVINKDILAVWCNRFIAKLIIMIFPLMALGAYLHDHFLNIRAVAAFMLYQLLISFIMILYEIYSCTWGHHDEPSFLYRINDLAGHHEEVWTKRKQYLQNKKTKTSQFRDTGFSGA